MSSIGQYQLTNNLHPMTDAPSFATHSTQPQCPEFFLEEQIDTQCEIEEELYDADTWNHIFPSFIFDAFVAETDHSLVWQGRYKDSAENVALKITQTFESQGSQKIHQAKQNAFLKEHRLGHMVVVWDIQNAKDFRLMVMRPYPWNLTQILRRFTNTTKRYSEQHLDFIIFSFKQVLVAAEEIHNEGYVHRDLKPDNFLVDSQANIVVTDFAFITRQLEIDVSSSGTLEYLPPQRLSKKRRQYPIKKSVDFWALGIILYEFFTGETPFNGECEEEILDAICEGYISNKGIPELAMSLIDGMLQVNNEKRFTIDEIKSHPFLQAEISKSAILASFTNI